MISGSTYAIVMAGPLQGLVVLDLSRVLAGPWAGQMLADLGADVVKVERPHTGDDTRSWGPPWIGDQAAYFLAANRGKRSIAVDISQVEGQAIVRKLAERADILIENYKRGALQRYGLDAVSLCDLNQRLIYCSITGFGQTGPNADKPGYDFIVQAMAGLMSVTGSPDSGPMKAGVAISDITTGLYSVIAILTALHERTRSGLGQSIDMALFDVQLGWMANQAMNYFATQRSPSLMGNAHPNIVPYQDFPTRDGHIVIAVGNDAQFARFAKVLNRENWASDARYVRNQDRVKNRDLLIAEINAVTRTRASSEWLRALDSAEIPCGPINTLAQSFASDQASARNLKIELVASDGVVVPQVANPIKLSRTPIEYHQPPPRLGAHTDDILAQLGYDAATIQMLRERAVIG
jgi:crotonobetainyl-CoA:carnitine CoA-transferase CaiB-like acyl-CoA transferase